MTCKLTTAEQVALNPVYRGMSAIMGCKLATAEADQVSLDPVYRGMSAIMSCKLPKSV